jgi:hypothetical protein
VTVALPPRHCTLEDSSFSSLIARTLRSFASFPEFLFHAANQFKHTAKPRYAIQNTFTATSTG